MSEASEIPDVTFLAAVRDECAVTGYWANGPAVAERLGIDPVVARKKFRRVYKRGLVTGCGCPCRGDWELTAKGKELLLR